MKSCQSSGLAVLKDNLGNSAGVQPWQKLFEKALLRRLSVLFPSQPPLLLWSRFQLLPFVQAWATLQLHHSHVCAWLCILFDPDPNPQADIPAWLWSSCISVDLPGDHRWGPGPCCPQQSYTALIVQIPLDWTLDGELLPCCHSWLPAPFPLWGRPYSLLCVIWNKWTMDNVYYNIATCCWFKYNQELILGVYMCFLKDKRFLRLNIDILQMFHNSSSNAVSAVLQG